ncbi:MAG: squalene/phytoene synthase family protein, partial [Verrucomicrobiota bacterium]
RQGQVTPAWSEFMAFQIERAREYYRDSEAGISHLEADGSRRAVWVMRDVYAGILEEIEKMNYDVFQGRCYVSFPRKCGLVLRRLLLK